MGNQHFGRKINNILTCSTMTQDISSSSEASSLQSGSSNSSSKSAENVEAGVLPEHFRVIKRIGKGSFGQVYAVEKRNSKELFAMKLIDKDSGEARLNAITNEVDVLASLNHPFIITLWFAFQDEDTIYLIFELLSGGDLRRSLEVQSHLPEAQVLIYICQLAIALDYLKSKRILHRDIKPENLLLDSRGRIRLTDFNVAVELKEGEFAISLSGTKPYIAPEVYKCVLNMGPGYSFPADWWSLGICAFELLSGERPYDIHSHTSYEDILGMMLLKKLIFPKRVQNGMIDLIKQLLCVESEQRICNKAQLQKHAYVAHIDFNELYNEERPENSDQLSES